MPLKLYDPDWAAGVMVEAREGKWVDAAAFAKLQEHYKGEVHRFNAMMAAKNATLTRLEDMLIKLGARIGPDQT